MFNFTKNIIFLGAKHYFGVGEIAILIPMKVGNGK